MIEIPESYLRPVKVVEGVCITANIDATPGDERIYFWKGRQNQPNSNVIVYKKPFGSKDMLADFAWREGVGKAAVGDFNGDGHRDIVYYNGNGRGKMLTYNAPKKRFELVDVTIKAEAATK